MTFRIRKYDFDYRSQLLHEKTAKGPGRRDSLRSDHPSHDFPPTTSRKPYQDECLRSRCTRRARTVKPLAIVIPPPSRQRGTWEGSARADRVQAGQGEGRPLNIVRLRQGRRHKAVHATTYIETTLRNRGRAKDRETTATYGRTATRPSVDRRPAVPDSVRPVRDSREKRTLNWAVTSIRST